MINQGIPWYYQEPFMPARPQDLVLWVNSSSWDGHTWRNLAPSYSNVNHGTLKNGVAIGDLIHPSGVFGAGLKFDGVDDYSNHGTDSSLNITEAITIGVWVKAKSWTSPANVPIVDKWYDGSKRAYYMWGMPGGEIKIGLSNSTGAMQLEATTTNFNMNTDEWYHVAMTWSTSLGTANFYKNGIYIESLGSGISDTIYPNTKELIIGTDYTGDDVFNGTTPLIEIYNQARSAGEIFHNCTHAPIYYLEHGIDPLQLIQQTPQEVARVVA